ncbi:hypothetical protein QOZ80_3BG0275810 [Eleusine coracana subsp. coracana]|nr:hypothetical protein QOZ80_3BG0275810 [Eleusine coracana subsp. coracana]
MCILSRRVINRELHSCIPFPTSQSFKMQSRRWQHGSSDELDVFGATRYFAGYADCTAVTQSAAESLTQAKVMMAANFRGHEDEQLGVQDRRHVQELELANKIKGKSKLAAFFGFMVSPSLGTSFRKRKPKVSSSSISLSHESNHDLITSPASMQLEDRAYGFDLGIATGDTRLQGVKVMTDTASGDEERWVVRCNLCWHEKDQQADVEIFYAASSDDHRDQVDNEGEDGANPGNWESDSTSDLFDLDIEQVVDLL